MDVLDYKYAIRFHKLTLAILLSGVQYLIGLLIS